MYDPDVKNYEIAAIKHENSPLCWLSSKYHISVERILMLAEMDARNRVAVLSEPMLPVAVGSNPNDSDVYCPSCRETLSGNWNKEHPEDRILYQCPHCGQAINPFKTHKDISYMSDIYTKLDTPKNLWDFWYDNPTGVITFFNKQGFIIDDTDYPMETKVLSVFSLNAEKCHRYVTLDV